MRPFCNRIIAAFVTLSILFAVVARVPGGMLSMDDGALTYEICTADGLVEITIPNDVDPPSHPDRGCDFFAAQTAALLADTLFVERSGAAFYPVAWPLQDRSGAKSFAAAFFLIRGPPIPS